jgi:putative nucleotidyltransferase with HDIG domain
MSSAADLEEILDAISVDPGLTSNVLRLANSPAYGTRSEITSVRNAVVRLGSRKVMELITLSISGPRLKGPVSGYDLPAGKLLEHAIFVSYAGEALARNLDVSEADQVFTAGLLHDIGKIVLGEFLNDEARSILAYATERHMPFHLAEEEILGISHTEVGAALLNTWGLPEPIVAAAHWHHDPDQYEGPASTIVGLVHVADSLSMMAGVGVGVDGLNYEPSAAVVRRLDLKVDQLEEILSTTLARLDEVRTVLGLQ